MAAYGRCVIIGSGFSGLCTAIALAPFFRKITILEASPSLVERDHGIHQREHIHVLLKGGFDLLCDLVPDIQRDFLHHQVVKAQIPKDVVWHTGYGSINTDFPLWSPSFFSERTLLDQVLYEQVQKIPNVEFEFAHRVESFGWDASRQTVKSVSGFQAIENRFKQAADFFVCCAGRGFQLSKSFLDLNLQAEVSRTVPTDIIYRTQKILIDPEDAPPWKLFISSALPPQKPISVSVLKVKEPNEYVFASACYYQQKPAKWFHANFASLLSKHFSSSIENLYVNSQKTGAPAYFHITQSRHNRFGKAKKWPHNMVALGDQVSSFNPIYGQGMSLALQQVFTLKNSLGDHCQLLDQFNALEVQKKIDKQLGSPWNLATADDTLALVEKKNLLDRLGSAFTKGYLKACVKDAQMAETFIKVASLKENPAALFKPRSILKSIASLY